ncbi:MULTISPECIES: ParB/RepB/Spo0J family partition protein [Terrabacteria group]|uniref:ParB/RepB/Spo0J family partition protein n=1 Tax=Bacillati TaxID=1783272 RepID=UPI00193A9AF5|nr:MULTISPECIES: ParB/RepB/Spo0J family partition protein [Terrabacteria group]MBW9212488.1 ParB/RepB/Spo0J family partition protein [Trueperella sp. zg.1013]QRG86756.1 ParB/RepB/Spo0J family partition protein [Bulleidia sp. zg-1006]
MATIFDLFEKKDESRIVQLPMDKVLPSRYQPRLHFDEGALKELAQSIQETGLIQPITVRHMGNQYEIIAGERRFRACEYLGYATIPSFVMTPTEEQAAQMALVENVQRENLSAVEEAKSYVELMRQASLTQEQMARKIGKSQSSVANKIRLLNLPEEIQQGVINNKITERHARALLTIPEDKQKEAYHYIVDNGLNVRQSEVYLSDMNKTKKIKKIHLKRGYAKNIKLAINTINYQVEQLKNMGLDLKSHVIEEGDDVKIIISMKK